MVELLTSNQSARGECDLFFGSFIYLKICSVVIFYYY